MGMAALIIGMLTALPQLGDSLKALLGALGVLYDEIANVVGADPTKVDAVLAAARSQVDAVEKDWITIRPTAIMLFEEVNPGTRISFPTIADEMDAALKLFYVADSLMKDYGISRHDARTVAQNAVNSVRHAN